MAIHLLEGLGLLGHRNIIFGIVVVGLVITKNTVILFPSTTEHYVGEHIGIGSRMSIAFNSFVKDSIGDVNTKTELIFR